MDRVAIYAIATTEAPNVICYVGSAKDPAKRLWQHRRGVDGAGTRSWFLANSEHLICYVIEWVDSDLRLVAESYWYRRFYLDARAAGRWLVNYPWGEAFDRAKLHKADVAFEVRSAFSFTHKDGMTWRAVEHSPVDNWHI